jgi:outer membrane protein W
MESGSPAVTSSCARSPTSPDLQANYIADKTTAADGTGIPVTGYGLAPTVQLQLKPVGHTPYLGAGLVYLHLATADATGSAFGLLLNAGYEWRFASHVGVMVGGASST